VANNDAFFIAEDRDAVAETGHREVHNGKAADIPARRYSAVKESQRGDPLSAGLALASVVAVDVSQPRLVGFAHVFDAVVRDVCHGLWRLRFGWGKSVLAQSCLDR